MFSDPRCICKSPPRGNNVQWPGLIVKDTVPRKWEIQNPLSFLCSESNKISLNACSIFRNLLKEFVHPGSLSLLASNTEDCFAFSALAFPCRKQKKLTQCVTHFRNSSKEFVHPGSLSLLASNTEDYFAFSFESVATGSGTISKKSKKCSVFGDLIAVFKELVILGKIALRRKSKKCQW